MDICYKVKGNIRFAKERARDRRDAREREGGCAGKKANLEEWRGIKGQGLLWEHTGLDERFLVWPAPAAAARVPVSVLYLLAG
ncbi:hypothetical protein ElyMa_000492800, partial [Elysia marginata]